MRSTTALTFCFLILSLSIAGNRNTSAQSTPHRPIPKPTSQAKSTSQVPLAYSLQEITVKTQILPHENQQVHFLALTDKGEVVVGTRYGIYTEKRKVVQVGDVIDGMAISAISDARTNSQGRIACRVYGYRQKGTQEEPSYPGVFVDDHLAFEYPGGMYDFELGNSGTPYLISFRSTYTTDGKNWSPDGTPLPPDVVNNLPYHFDTSDIHHPHVMRSGIPVSPAWHPFEVPDHLPGQASQMPSGPIITSPSFIPETHYGLSDSPVTRLGKLFFSPAGLPSNAYGGATTVDAYYNADEEPVVIVADSRGKGDPRYSGSTGKVGSGVIWGPRGLVAGYLTTTGQITRGFSTKNSYYPFEANNPIINRPGQLLFKTSGSGTSNADGLFKFVLATPDNASVPEPDRPMAGDIVVYRGIDEHTGASIIIHSGVIVDGGVLPDGTVTQIESKWASMGLYIHDPNDSIYGKSWTVWRAKRKDGSHSNLLIRRRHIALKFINMSYYYTDRAINQDDCVASSYRTSRNGGVSEEDRKKVNKYMATRNKIRYPVFTVVEDSTGTYNCHGYTFTGSKAYVPPENAQRIINDDGYYQISGARDTDKLPH